jgi:uncharacterized protein YdbL (DUF1318 family)
MKKMNRICKCVTIVVLFACTVFAWGEGEKARMAERVPKIDTLKTAGIVGEKTSGLLGFVKESPADKALVDAENKDREAVYEAIAKKQGVSASTVAKSRAASLAKKAVSGLWLQDAKGKWFQKK